jgi:hypothetical protein
VRTVIVERQPADELFLLMDGAHGPMVEHGEHGRRDYFAYSEATDAPGNTEPMRRSDLVQLQNDHDVVWVDVGPNGEGGLFITGFDRRRARSRVRSDEGDATPLQRLPQLQWRRRILGALAEGERATEVAKRRSRIASVIVTTRTVAAAVDRIDRALGRRAHPEIIVATPDDLPRPWRDVLAEWK